MVHSLFKQQKESIKQLKNLKLESFLEKERWFNTP